MIKTRFLAILMLSVFLLSNVSTIGQENTKAVQVDEFRQVSNDELMARVASLYTELTKRSDSVAVAALSGNSWEKHTNMLRIMGCHEWLKLRTDLISFVFSDAAEVKVDFWIVRKGVEMSNPHYHPVNYLLSDLKKPVELTVSMGTDEYCPRIFDIALYAKFLIANPEFTGRIVIDSNRQREFVGRVFKYRRQLARLNIDPKRLKYFRRHFHGERDEQFWLIPPKRK